MSFDLFHLADADEIREMQKSDNTTRILTTVGLFLNRC